MKAQVFEADGKVRICPTCGEVYDGDTEVCPADKTPLDEWGDAVKQSMTRKLQSSTVHLGSAAGKPAQSADSKGPLPRTVQLSESQLDGRSPVSPAAPPEGKLLGDRYRLKRPLGVGGFGAVFEAEDTRLSKRVAVKILSPHLAGEAETRARFKLEAISASQIGHEGIVNVTDIGEDEDGSQFIVMEFLHGRDLAKVMEQEGPLGVPRALGICAQIAYALDAAHRKQIIHRDLKPANIYLVERETRRDFVKVIDFGISKMIAHNQSPKNLTSRGAIVGTSLYMAPEQARADVNIDHRLDVYALGVILFELLTGEPPFNGESLVIVLAQHQGEAPPVPSSKRAGLSPQIDELILRALEKEPADRYQTMRDFGDRMMEILNESDPRAASAIRPIRAQTADPFMSPPEPGPATATSATPTTLRRSVGELRVQTDHVPRPSNRSSRWVGLAAATLVLAAVGLFAAGGFAGDVEKAAQVPPPPIEEVEPVPPPPPEIRKIHLTSNTPGAETFTPEGTPLGSLPLDLDAPTGDDVRLVVVRAKAHDDQTITLTSASASHMDIVLIKTAAAMTSTAAKPPKGKKSKKMRKKKRREGTQTDSDIANTW